MAVAPDRPPIPVPGMRPIQFAEWYVTVPRWSIFPLASMSKEPLFRSPHSKGHTCKGECGKLGHGVYDATNDLETVRQWWTDNPTANIGLAVPEGHIALDADSKRGGPDSLEDLERLYSSLPDTITNLTGSGNRSFHKLLTVPAGALVRGTLGDDHPGIDIKKHPGGYLVVPPSLHPDTSQPYMWEADFDPHAIQEAAAAPEWLLALLAQGNGHAENGNSLTFDPRAIVTEGGRNTAYFTFVQHYHRLGVTDAPLRLMADEYNATMLQPSLDEAEADRTFLSACRYEVDAQLMVARANGIPLPAVPVGWTRPLNQDNTAPPQPQASAAAWVKDLFAYKNGELKQNGFNIGQVLRHHPYWQAEQRALWYDVIRGRAMCGEEQISKHLATAATQWFGGEMRLGISNLDLLKTCMESQAMQTERDLLKEHLANLPEWDSEPRLESWLSDVTEAPDDPYTREISRRLPVSMIARALFPGCQYREVVILEGKENAGKSHLVETLASTEWYVSLSMNMESKDAHIMLHQFWMAELAELDSISRTEDSRMKAFVTMQHDSYVPKYSNVSISIPRRTIFVGTTNDTGAYLKGQTGNTRYLPLWIGKRVDRAKLERDRDQILAEAIAHYYARLEDWWAMDAELEERAQEEREKRRERPVYEDPLNDWLEVDRFTGAIHDDGAPVKFTQGETSWPEIARWYLKLDTPEKWKDRSLQMQVASTLKALGWIHDTIYRHGHKARIWKKAEA